MKKVDVVINVYGKPFQTAVTLFTLNKFSGEHINRIYFIKEPNQPHNSEFDFIYDYFGDKIVVHTPKEWLWVGAPDARRFTEDDYRRSIRYQFAWEESKADYLFFTHNDVLYEGDIIGALSDNIGDYLGIGSVGQCWNCPAFSARLCHGDKYLQYRPTFEQLETIYEKYPSQRKVDPREIIDRKNPWTLPECRLNEWVALVDLKIARPETVPVGDATPFGAMTLDIGTRWFKEMSLKGYKFLNYDFDPIAKHAWANAAGNGHSALFDVDLYLHSEKLAKEILIRDFNLAAATLAGYETRKPWKAVVKSLLRKLKLIE